MSARAQEYRHKGYLKETAVTARNENGEAGQVSRRDFLKSFAAVCLGLAACSSGRLDGGLPDRLYGR